MPAKILFVDDDESLREVTAYHLKSDGYEVITAGDGNEAFARCEESTPDIIISDLSMPGMDGLQLLQKIKGISETAVFIMVTAHGSVESAVRAMKLGAYDYIEKPFKSDVLKAVVKRALRVLNLENENRNLRQVASEKFRFGNLIGTSEKMVEVIRSASQVAPLDSTVFILGESGTGKELLAKAIHVNSRRKDGPFVAINMGAISESLVDSELFGHEKGSFTGAAARHAGAFERASGGTLFLDEIADMRTDHQVRLLRVLQEREIQRVGGDRSIPIDVRVITATHRDIEALVKEGEFRDDLYYRLCVVPIKLPPLRERREDIPLLTAHFINKYRKEAGIHNLRVTDEAVEAFMKYRWPGNVRELENVVHRCIATSSSDEIRLADLPENVRRADNSTGKLLIDLPDEGIVLEDLEKEIIIRSLEKNDYNQSRTARYLGITRNTLLYRMEKFGLKQNP
ncbi:MAG: sigma-54 dependent transcriptional regulator [bacterium]